jgi:hypothetical protein
MTWFNRPYPLLEKTLTKLIVILGFGLFIPVFLYVYQPFGIAEVIEKYKWWYVVGIGLHISFVLALNYFLVPKIFPKFFNPERWTIWKEILYILSSFFLATCSNYVYSITIGKDISPYRSFTQFLGITVAVGIFPVMIMVFWMERSLSSRNTMKADEYSKLLPKKKRRKKAQQFLNIASESTKADDLQIALQDFIFATSDNNYSTIFFEKDGELQRKLLRLSFKNLENQVAEYDQIIRCHKSYIVNRDRILEIKGNARSLMLQVDLYEEMIPVSRSFPKENLM